ncbi:hypothetical protein Tco_1423733, partial [Tanacetum coccineum]
VLEEEPAVKPKHAKKPAKKFTTVPTTCVVIRDTLGVSVSKKKAPTKVDRGKDMDLLSKAALLKAIQLKKTLKKSKLETHKLLTSGSGDGVGSNQSDDDSNDDGSNDASNDDDYDDDDVDSNADGDNEASDSQKTDSDEDENPNLNQNEDEEEEYEEEYVCTPDNYEFSDDDEEYEELYKHVNIRLKDTLHEEEWKGDAEMTDVGRDDGTQQTTEVVSMMNVMVRHEEPSTQTPSLLNIPAMVIPETLTAAGPTIPPTIPPVTPLLQQSTPTPTPAPTTATTTASIPTLPDFSSLFGFDQRVSTLEKELSQFKQADYFAQLLEMIKSQIPAIIYAQLSTRLEDFIQKAFRSYTAEFEKKAKDEKKRYIDLIEKSVKEIIKDEVNTQLSQILPKEISDFATLVIQSSITESLENVVLAKSSSQPQSTYEAATSLIEFELKKILLDKMHKDAEPSKGSKSKESKSSSSKGTKSQSKSSGNTDDQPNVEAASKDDHFKKPKRPLTLDLDWNATKTIDFRPPQTWISKIAKVEKPPRTLDELISTPIDFSTYVMNNMKIKKLTQEHLVGPAFNLLKGTCKSRVELEYHFEECYKVVTDQLDWTNPEGQEYPFDLNNPLPLIKN